MRVRRTDKEIIERGKLGLALNLRELAIAMGYGYSKVREWHDKGMPLADGKITLAEAKAWQRRYEKSKRRLESQSQIPTVLHHPLLAADKSDAPGWKNDSRAA
jgi:hypothetical protein